MVGEKGFSKLKYGISKTRIIHRMFDHWEKRPLIINLIFAILPVAMYYLGYLNNIRENTGSIITYAAALLTLNGVFLTLLVALKGSQVFQRLKKLFPKLHDYLFYGLKRQVSSCIYFSLVNIAISIVGPLDNSWIIGIGIIIWSYYLVDVSIGAVYNLKIVTDLAVKDVESKKTMI
ncbi:MAG: hypothetical protein R3250_06860 [Melioribacteraceae bacterium]|nr:hypothetical protein [Melioribacteraceae bacterium]